jgi:DNA polymerase I-like protein with 3'-5' exonuclease and polymerase domains
VQLTYMLFQILKREIPRQEMKVIDLFVRMFTEPTLELDEEFLQAHLKSVQLKRAALIERLGELGGEDVIMSNPKFADLLRRLGVEPPTKISPRTGAPTFAFSKQDSGLKDLLQHPDLLVRTAVEVRLGVKSTIEETRTEAFLGIAARGAWPVYLNYYGAHTGRASGGDGVNPQNLHRGGALRKSVRAPEGYCIVAGDSSQIEARMTAYLADQDDLVTDFRNQVDIYSKFAEQVYLRPVSKVEHPTERFVGKTCILGLGYGMGSKKLQHTLGLGTGGPVVEMELGKCVEIVMTYRQLYSRIPYLWDCGDRALSAIVKGEEYTFGRGLLRTSAEGIHLPNDMIVRYPGLTWIPREGYVYAKNRREQAEWVKQTLSGQWDAGLLTRIYGGKVIENVVQALARIVVFDQMLKIAQRCRVVLTVHDEVVACVPKHDVAETVTFVTNVMSEAPAWAPTLPVACDVHSGATYGEAK